MEIRKYNSDDIKQLTDLMPDLGYPSSLDEMKVRMERIESNPNYYTFVAIHDNNLVWMIGITIHTTYTNNDEKIQITSLVTKKEYRGQDIAKALLKYVEEWSLKRGSDFIYLLSEKSERRVKAHELYKFLGYEVTGYRFVKRLRKMNTI
ncbi:GNAT family N-acetyltransferase [Bacillus pseudomycoides]|uniref:GNAT family N-acetyltransferase n=1 Tax=Bacillus pseudomycoides TaxID=64104 RepID=UPI000BECD045|nr:GNAT family N-acetyltransferase [Bacillus pseudomycoides]PED08447.1 GNAT family N-acetyltransferase [Bacillus pseudomycoides]PEI99825.1 GNAT family N-acetyltransferase [Bacillus pseudomycoides]PEK06917.1 GNAT family N-acetyltransferase [Bacillus pseudomycoides]PEM74540.1 GNAT family N-acetyltransferase [Bacillus pseudomycoides]PEO20045.1 GNAT family N-acetyltransferase [Bacillus pseudomycoides]